MKGFIDKSVNINYAMKRNKVARFGEVTTVNHPGLQGKLKEEHFEDPE